MENNIKTIINDLSNKIFIIEDEMASEKKYKKFIIQIYDYLKAGYEHKELRECAIYFRFHANSDIIPMQLRHFLTNIIFWEPAIVLCAVDKLDESFIVDCTKISSRYIKSYIDNKFVIPYRNTISNKKLNMILHDLIFNLSCISTDFNILLGLTMNIESFIDVAKKNPRFNEIIRTKLDESMQPSEIEDKLHRLMNEEIQILMNEESAFKPILRSGTGIKEKQLSEFSISGGLKPDLSGNTMPVPINSNLVVGGLGNVTNYFVDSIGGRKSLIMNKSVMGKSGHFARKTMLLVSNVTLRKDPEPCRSVHPIQYEIKTKEHLKRFVGRYYKLYNERDFHVLKGDETHLIGQKILVKSPITCASKHGICRECYGDVMYHTNKNVAIGSYAGAIITNPVSQSVLSAKHLLTTTSETIKFNKDFYEFFNLSANEIMINTDNDNLMDYSLVIIAENVVSINELDEGEINEFLTLFHIKNNKTGETVEIFEESGKDMYLSPDLIKAMGINKKNKKVYEANLADLPDDTRLFIMEIENNELTRPLYNIMGLLDTKERRRQMNIETMDDLAQKMLDLLIESKINVMSVHGEVLLNPLIRSESDILKRPNFTKYKAIDDYQILTVEAALEKHPSVLISLSFQFLGRQLLNPLTFKKTGTSFIDPFFKERP